MPYLSLPKSDKREEISLFYQDYGEGRPVLFIPGWPFSHRIWDRQLEAVVDAGYRAITYDRRGFGQSSQPWSGYDYDTFASDLRAVITGLELENVTLVGFHMGGGEVVRYLTNYGSSQINQAVLISSTVPLFVRKEDNSPDVFREELEDSLDSLREDRANFLREFGKDFVSFADMPHRSSEALLDFLWVIGSDAGHRATVQSAEVWMKTDFCSELPNLTVPTLMLHGTEDWIVPVEMADEMAAKGIRNSRYERIKGAPHGMVFTHAERVNELLVDFLKEALVRQSDDEPNYAYN